MRAMSIRQAMVAVGSRHVRLLLAGRGRPVLLLHGSPNTADALRPMIEALQRDFLVVAPDTPGNGASDPLVPRATVAARYADALAALLDALNLARVAVYGFHSGAAFAAELARRHRSRVSCAVCEGHPLWTSTEAGELADGYLAPLVPTADGAYLAALWSRVIDQNWYFPWHIKERGRRIEGGVGDIHRLHLRAMELLRAGDHYRRPYAAALRADGQQRLRDLAVPTLIACTEQDVLLRHLHRVPAHPALTVRRMADAAQMRRETQAWFKRHPPAVADLRVRPSRRRFVDLPDGQLLVDGDPQADAAWFHDAGESSLLSAADAAASDAVRLDLPGHGLSTMPWPDEPAALKTTLIQALATADVDVGRCSFDGKGLGRKLAGLVAGRLDAIESRPVDVPDIAPRWDGGHLLAAWHFCRFRTQYRPWSRRGPGLRRDAPLPSAAALHRMTRDVLRAGQRTLERTLPLSIEA